MAITFREAIDTMDYDELMRVKIELECGAVNMKKLVVQKVREAEKKHETKCAVCHTEINMHSTNNYTILFGPEDFKKKASLCALDCLEYFLGQLREMRGMKKKVS